MSRLKGPFFGISFVINEYLFFGLDGISSIFETGSKPELKILKLSFLEACFNSNK